MSSEERKKLILETIKKKGDSEPTQDTFKFTFEEFIPEKSRPIPGLGIRPSATEPERISLLQLLKTIEKDSKKAIIFNFPERKPIKPLAGLISQVEIQEINRPIFYAHIRDLEKFNEYHKRIIQPPEKAPVLILNNEGRLSRVDNKKREFVYPMNPSGLRYKMVHFLAIEKHSIQTKELAKEFGKKSEEIRKIIGEIRENITEKLKIPGDKIIENSPGSGYKIKNIRVRRT